MAKSLFMRLIKFTPAVLLAALLLAGFSALATAPTIGITSFNSNFSAQTPLLGATPSPGTVDNPGSSGWDFTVASPGGDVSMSAADEGANPGGTSDFCIRMNRSTAGFFVQTITIKSDDGSAFSLKYVYLKINLFSGASADMTITGYKGGVAVSGATKTITGILTNPVWTQFDVSAIAAFGNVDEFVFTQAASSSAGISFEAIDQIDIASPVALPLTLTNFTGQLSGSNVLLNWTTASEENTSYFEIQRGTDGSVYAPLGQVSAAGNSTAARQYQYTDALPPVPAPAYFYRLKMADIDGNFTYSPVVAINPSVTSLALSATPNPFQQQITLTVNSPGPDYAVVTINDMGGRSLFTQSVPIQKGSNNVILRPISELQKGIYLLTISTKSKKQTIELLKGD
jgi:Secretion system C-terminal sorting domain